MNPLAALPPSVPELINHLIDAGEHLPEQVAAGLTQCGPGAVPALLGVLTDEALFPEDARGKGYAPLHAVAVLERLRAPEAIGPMLRVLSGLDCMDLLYSELIAVLIDSGPAVLEPALEAHATAQGDGRTGIAEVLARCGAKDERILPVLVAEAESDPALAKDFLLSYLGEAAHTRLSAALDEASSERAPILDRALRLVTGELTFGNQGHFGVQLSEKAGGSAPRDPFAARAAEFRSWLGDHPQEGVSPGWIDLALRYAWEFTGADPDEVGADALREVVFEIFPRKVSCEAADAPEIVRSLRAYFCFTRDALADPLAAACLEVLSGTAEDRLGKALDDPGNWGMAKSTVMNGRRSGYAVETEAGLNAWMRELALRGGLEPRSTSFALGRATQPLDRDAKKAKKKARKAKQQAKRRNRR